MSYSRTKNIIRNFSISLFIQVITLAITFINRTVFIQILNSDYLGVNGLFTNILTILSFAELGVGSAIIYSMYKPVKEDNKKKIATLLNLYAVAYRYIAIVITIIGICVLPFIDYLISEPPQISENIKIIYLLFLANTVSSYIFSYRKSLFTVYQKEYVNIVIERIGHILCCIIQLMFLYATHNYIGYLLIQILATLISNLIIYLKAKKSFPYIISCHKQKMEKKEIYEIFGNIKNILYYKIGSVILNATDNIIITKIIGVSAVGICSNYVLLINTVESVLAKALNSIVASIGNLNASNCIEKKRAVFEELNLCVYWIYGFVSIEFGIMLNPIICLWLGETYVIESIWTILALVLNFYIFGTNFGPSNYRVTMGFFKEARMAPILASVINIALSIFLGLKIGLVGIYISTSIARVLTFGIIDPVIVYKKGFGMSPIKFYMKEILFIVVTIGNGFICYKFIDALKISGFIGVILDCFIIGIVSNIIYLIIYVNTRECKSLIKRFVHIR